jgi:hypothetical protein
MKRRIEAIVLVLVIAALTAYLILQRKDGTHYSLPELPRIDKGEISRITIQKGGSGLELKRDAENWRILPEGYPADGKAVDRMLETLGGLRLTAMASTSENDSLFDLDEASCVLVAAYRGEDLLVEIGIGKAAPTYRHTFVKLRGDGRVYHAEKNFRGEFDKDISSLRDKQVLKIDEGVSEIILTAAGGESLHILRTTVPADVDPTAANQEAEAGGPAQGAARWETLEGIPLEEKEIDTLVKTLSNLQCDGYIEERKPDLGPPTFSASLKGSRTYELSLYGEKDGRTIATSSECEVPFLLADWKATRIKKNPEDLLKKME